jgi:hypothetical protein
MPQNLVATATTIINASALRVWSVCRASSFVAGRLVDDRLSSEGVDVDVQAAGDPG